MSGNFAWGTKKTCTPGGEEKSISTFAVSLGQTEILECKFKWALGSVTTNKASGCDGIPTELFKILKDDAVKLLHSD